ncbi:MAG TPA: glucose-6-phosphate isomerase [Gemmatimonadaceae bacterium]|nr:glucose-6-phosphate isomerase [Gemmatimonadaceae bacterium]
MIHLDYTNMLAPAVKGGIPAAAWRSAPRLFAKAQKQFHKRRDQGELGFLDLPTDQALHRQSTDFAKRTRGRFDDVVVLGIGGSALGPIALRTALRKPFWNMLDAGERDMRPRLQVLDNLDPTTIAALLERLELERSLFIVISKSGGTAETMAQYLVVRDRLDQAKIAAANHVVFITDPSKGALRPIAQAQRIPALDIPPNVGGRFSVLTPVGVLPAALIGIDTTRLLAGAADMVQRCTADDLHANPAGLFAALQYLADSKSGKHIHVLMPYADALRDMAAWFVQLWAESLGKTRIKDGEHVGPTPLGALGATDQHSQVQLFMEGPADKTVSFVAIPRLPKDDVSIPRLHQAVPDLAYLGGHSLGEVLDIERRATAGALARRGRPNMTFELEAMDAWHVGAFIMLLECATIYAGALYGVNPLDQPGVELGKQFTYAMLGRPGSAEARKDFEKLPKPDPKLRS